LIFITACSQDTYRLRFAIFLPRTRTNRLSVSPTVPSIARARRNNSAQVDLQHRRFPVLEQIRNSSESLRRVHFFPPLQFREFSCYGETLIQQHLSARVSFRPFYELLHRYHLRATYTPEKAINLLA